MDFMEFATRAEAKREAAEIRSWETRVLRLHLVDREGNRRQPWVIACRNIGSTGDWMYLDWMYLRRDGYVR